jgi:hypothetical protein
MALGLSTRDLIPYGAALALSIIAVVAALYRIYYYFLFLV